MKPGAPWSIKGVDGAAREAAKVAAREAGLSLGAWLNRTILATDSPPADPTASDDAAARKETRRAAPRLSGLSDAGGTNGESGMTLVLQVLNRMDRRLSALDRRLATIEQNARGEEPEAEAAAKLPDLFDLPEAGAPPPLPPPVSASPPASASPTVEEIASPPSAEAPAVPDQEATPARTGAERPAIAQTQIEVEALAEAEARVEAAALVAPEVPAQGDVQTPEGQAHAPWPAPEQEVAATSSAAMMLTGPAVGKPVRTAPRIDAVPFDALKLPPRRRLSARSSGIGSQRVGVIAVVLLLAGGIALYYGRQHGGSLNKAAIAEASPAGQPAATPSPPAKTLPPVAPAKQPAAQAGAAPAAPADPAADYALALRIVNGGGSPDYARAAELFEKAANHGIVDAAYNLGVIHERGLGRPKDMARAVAWYRRAAEKNHLRAQYNLAVLNANGDGIARNYTEAATWFERAAAGGLANAQYDLAILLERGIGVPKDLRLAYQWLSIAALHGDADARTERDRLRPELSAADVAAAERAATAFRSIGTAR